MASGSETRVYGVGARQVFEEMPVNAPAIEVTVWRQLHDDIPLYRFAFSPLMGGEQRFSPPVICAPGSWLCATIRPVVDRVEVMAAVGSNNLRAIPIVNLGIVEGL